MVSIKIVIWQAPTRKAFQPSFQSQRDWLAKFRHDRWPLPLPLSSPSLRSEHETISFYPRSSRHVFQSHVPKPRNTTTSPPPLPPRVSHSKGMDASKRDEGGGFSLAEGRTHIYIYIHKIAVVERLATSGKSNNCNIKYCI